jgi:hypothetical protein
MRKGNRAKRESILSHLFFSNKKKVEAMIHAGDVEKADVYIAKLREIYIKSGKSIKEKKAYDGGKAGLERSRERDQRRPSSKTSKRSFKKINNFKIIKKVLLADGGNPDLTVALPMYNSMDIAWVAFESLAMQKNVTFNWELVIAEENHFGQIGEALSLEYLERLKKAGCSRIVYIEIGTWMPLFQKWMLIHKHSSSSSKAFILQAADCFSQLHRLVETLHLFSKNDPDWVQSKRGYFYNIRYKKLALYDHDSLLKHESKNMRTHPCCLNMAVKYSLMSLLTEVDCRKGVDRKIYTQIERKNGKMKVVYNESNSYLTGIDTDGYNNLSKSRASKIVRPAAPFVRPKRRLFKLLPKSIIRKFNEMK